MHGTKPVLDPLEQPIVRDTWREKYAYRGEESWNDTCLRVSRALDGGALDFGHEIYRAMLSREIVPAGRILAGAGTDKRVTLINCFVSPDIQDSMCTEPDLPGCGIMDALSKAAYTLQMGGGIGMDFSTIRPRGAVVKRTSSQSSGVMPFMDMWHYMSETIMSAGHRRGAMMGTLGVWHPDIEEFIAAKHQRGRLTNFNVSVLVPDIFMEAVDKDGWWDLTFPVPRADNTVSVPFAAIDSERPVFFRAKENGEIYKRVRARELWDKIIQSTYVHAEPGVIFIGRVNQLNNLSYCEHIHACNPCGEQMLPANGDCNLGHTNLAVMVDEPFTDRAAFNFGKLERAAATMVRLLDNVLDATLWPTEEQRQEAMAKRRVGLGFTGLASALQQLGVPYGSEAAVEFTRRVARTQAIAAYTASIQLAKERGPFPLYDYDKHACAPFVQKVLDWYPKELAYPALEDDLRAHGIRNGVLLSVAPTGTTSLVLGNVSSGIEPVFAHRYRRKVRGGNGQMENEYSVYDYGYLKFCQTKGLDPEDPEQLATMQHVVPGSYPGFVTSDQLTVEQHLQMAAAAQEWVDSAISKTINCPTSMGVDEFRQVYTRAYELGMKGCTTYRPDPRSGRGAVLETESTEQKKTIKGLLPLTGFYPGEGNNREDVTPARGAQPDQGKFTENRVGFEPSPTATPHVNDKVPMQDVAEGRRYRIKWPHEDCAYYVIITDVDDPAMPRGRRPFELFISTKSTRHEEWVKAFSLMATAIFRREGDPSFIVDELRTVFSAKGGGWLSVAGKEGRRHVPSLVAAVGAKIEEHLVHLGMMGEADPLVAPVGETHAADMAMCEVCGALAVKHESGCSTCMACGASDCG